jgi:hypothetical protein
MFWVASGREIGQVYRGNENASLVRIRQADEPALVELVLGGLESLDASQLRAFFLNPHLSESVVLRILERSEYLQNLTIRRALAGHRRTPLQEALRLIPTVFWNDLLELGRDARVRPAVRRAAHQTLTARYEALAVGERIVIARRAGVEMLARIRLDPEPRVIRALLENPRLTEGALQIMATSSTTKPQALALIATSPKWLARPEVCRMLCSNRQTPLEVVLPLLARVDKRDLERLETLPGVDPQVRRRARTLLGRDSLS